jgi:hypothetical protein
VVQKTGIPGDPYVRSASYSGAFEVTVIEFFDGSLQVVGIFEFNKSFKRPVNKRDFPKSNGKVA